MIIRRHDCLSHFALLFLLSFHGMRHAFIEVVLPLPATLTFSGKRGILSSSRFFIYSSISFRFGISLSHRVRNYYSGKYHTRLVYHWAWGEPNWSEGLPLVWGNNGTLAKYRREQGNVSLFLGDRETELYKLEKENMVCKFIKGEQK